MHIQIKNYSPYAYLLILVSKMQAVSRVKVVGLKVVHGGTKEVLHTALRGQVVEIAGQLGDLIQCKFMSVRACLHCPTKPSDISHLTVTD